MSFPVGKLTCYYNNKITRPPWRYLSNNESDSRNEVSSTLESGLAYKMRSRKIRKSLTLSLLGVPAVVRLGDALAMDYREAWFTPAYLIAWPHFKRRIGRGNYPITATVPKAPGSPVTEPKEAPAVTPTESPQKEKITHEIAQKCDENGQMSLF